MRIVIDMQGAQAENKNRGIGRYSLALTQGLVRHSGNHEIILALNGALADTIEPLRAAFQHELPQSAIRVWRPVTPARHLEPDNDWRRVASEKLYEAFLKSLQPDVVVITSLFEGLGQDAVTSINQLTDLPVAVVLYDLIPLINRSPYLDNSVVKRWYEEKITFLQKASLLLSISESSRQEALHYLDFSKNKVVNISTDADPQFAIQAYTTNQVTSLFQKYGIEKDLVLYTGGIDHRKNIEGLISAYSHLPASLREQHQLAIVCSMAEPDKIRLKALACSEGLETHELVLTDFVPEEDLIALYNLCKVFVFPSWHEGFGLPALEAMRCGAVVIGSNTSSLPEVIGTKEALFDPHDCRDITRKLKQVLTDNGLRQRLKQYAIEQAKSFSWDQTARLALSALENQFLDKNIYLAPTKKNHCHTKKPKLAYISPLPPERSGISDYSAELLPALAEYYNIDVVVDQKRVDNLWVKEHCKIISPANFIETSLGYDRVLYHFGNSPFHKHMFNLLEKVPGVVVLHDFFISGVVDYIDSKGLNPGFLSKELYDGHGYVGLISQFHGENVGWHYPCNNFVLNHAKGIVVHSEFSKVLARKWYPHNNYFAQWSLIPHLRVLEEINDIKKHLAREKLNIPSDSFLVCSFGMLVKTKLNDRLLDAWLSSELANDEKCKLIFVGELDNGDYGQKIKEKIKNSGLAHRIHIIGWADHQVFKNYLEAADIGVQLRSMTRGETSGTVLDCMNYGLATIVNANGSMAELPEKAVWKLEDEFEDHALTHAIEQLWHSSEMRNRLSNNARKVIEIEHSPEACARKYYNYIENLYNGFNISLERLIESVVQPDLTDIGTLKDLKNLACIIDYNIPNQMAQPQLLVDISELVQRDARSGIQRAVRSLLKEWLKNPPKGYRVEPVYAMTDRPGYFYARTFTLQFLECPEGILNDEPISYSNGDVFVGLDLNHHVASAQKDYITTLRRSGVYISYVIYDLLPIQYPQFWEPQHNVKKLHHDWLEVVTRYDSAICISQSVADELDEWVQEHGKPRERPLCIDWFHLGADVENSNPSLGVPTDAEKVLNHLRARTSFLMVGTLEPRKGYSEVLDCFDKLWQRNEDINLVIVGKKGWLVDNLIERLSTHPQLDSKLFWLDGVSDQYLDKVYKASSCLIAASYGEGFGLPLIEAAQNGLPIIARDIAVFREVAGASASYFGSSEPENLANIIEQWISLYKEEKHTPYKEITWLTWEQSAMMLSEKLSKNGAFNV